MPFDGAGYSRDPALQKLDAVLALLNSEDHWCKGTLKTPDGRYCLRGAMQAAGAQALLEPFVLSAIREVTGRRFLRVETFNDRRTTSHEMVLMVLHCAGDQIVLGRAAALENQRQRGPWLKSLATWFAQRFDPARNSLSHS